MIHLIPGSGRSRRRVRIPIAEHLEHRVVLSGDAAGYIDPTYGDGGRAASPIAGPRADVFEQITDTAVQPDGRAILAGWTWDTRHDSDYDFVAYRFNRDGSLDTSFADHGRLIADVGGADLLTSAAVLSDGRLVLGGSSGVFAGPATFALACFEPDGSPSVAFGADGKLTLPGLGQVSDLAATTDGRLVASYSGTGIGDSFHAARVLGDGTLDPSFGTGGIASVNTGGAGAATAVALAPGGRVFLTGVYNGADGWLATGLARLTADGSPDASFGAAGVVNWPNAETYFTDVAAAPDGGAVVVKQGRYGLLLTRVGDNGARHPAWHNSADPGDPWASAVGAADRSVTLAGVIVQDDAKVVVGGSFEEPAQGRPHRALVARFNPDGSPDAGYGTGGKLITDTGLSGYVADIARDGDGNVMLAGGSTFSGASWVERRLAAPSPAGPPVARIVLTGPITEAGPSSAINGDATFDPNGTIVKWEWDGDYDGTQFGTDIIGYSLAMDFGRVDGPSQRTIALRVTDADGNTAITSRTIDVQNVPPKVSIGGAQSVNEGAMYTLALSAGGDPGTDTIQSWTIDWGDNTPPQTVAGNPQSVTHVYADGPSVTRPITATATDEDGTYAASVGRLDPTYGGGDGWGSFGNFGTFTAAALQPDGSVVTGGGLGTAGLAGLAVFRLDPSGLLDQNFGTGGKARIDPALKGEVRALALQGDGKIVAAGYLNRAAAANEPPVLDWVVLRVNPDGSLDSGFGDGGTFTLDLGANDDAVNGVAVQSDGKIVLAGKGGGEALLLRLNPDGTVNQAFGPSGNGRVAAAFGDGASGFNDLVLLPGDGLLAAGAAGDDYALARFDKDGAADVSFGTSGVARGPGNIATRRSINRVVVAPGGKIVAAAEGNSLGSGAQGTWALRFNADGSPDTSFGAGGAVPAPWPSLTAIAVDPDGRALLAGAVGAGQGTLLTVARLRPNGSPDPSFGDGGTVNAVLDPFGRFLSGRLLLQPDGKPVVVGSSANSSYGFVARLEVLDRVRVDNVAPILTLGGVGAAYPGEPYALQLGHADPGADTISHWQIDWGDGAAERVDGAPAEAPHAYAAAGAYEINARAFDEDGDYAAEPVVVRVAPPARLDPDGTLNVFGIDTDDAIDLALAAGGRLVVTVNGLSQSFAAADVARVNVLAMGGPDTVHIGAGVVGGTIDLGDGQDRLTLNAGAAATPLTVRGGAGNDTFTVSSPTAAVTIDGGDGDDGVTVTGTAGDDTIAVGFDSVSVPGAGAVAFTAAESVRIDPAAGADTMSVDTVTGAPPGAPPPPLVSVDLGGAGSDVVDFVASPAGARAGVTFGTGADAVRLRPAALGAFSVSGFTRPDQQITWDASDGDDTITVQSSSRTGTTVTGDNRTLVAPAGGGPTLVLNGNGGADTFDVLSPPLPLVLDGGDGDDRFDVRRDTNSSLAIAALTLRGGPGVDSAVVDDRVGGFLFPGSYALSDAALAAGPVTAALDGLESFTLEAPLVANAIRVTPSERVTFTVHGNNPPPGGTTGDRLTFNLDGAAPPQLEPSDSPGSGRYMFADRRDVVFSGIEFLPEFVPPVVTAGQFLDTNPPKIRLTLSERLEVSRLRIVNAATGAVVSGSPTQTVYDTAAGTYTYTLGNLPDGDYRAELRAADATDLSGNHPEADYLLPFRIVNAIHVAGRHVFYNGSVFDGGADAIDAADAAAIAEDKQALRPGESATYGNVTNYMKGINGIMVDVARFPFSTLRASDFEFRAGSGGDPAAWPLAPAPAEMTFVRGTGVNGTDRVTFVWPGGAIRNAWLRVTLKSGANTGLASPDVFLFGNLIGDADGNLRVNALDLAAVKRNLNTDAEITSRFDFNRDGRIDALDVAALKQNLSHSLNAAPAPTVSPVTAAPAALVVTRTWDEVQPDLLA